MAEALVITPEMRRALLLLLMLAGLLCSCTPGIGSGCIQSTDCSPTGQLLCDTSQPGGYCTVFNCQPDRCPSGSTCVITNISPLDCPYDDRHAPSRFSRRLCLQLCNQDSDCRNGNIPPYVCVNPADRGLLDIDLQTLQTNLQLQTLAEGGTEITGYYKVCLPEVDHAVTGGVDGSVAPVCSNSGPPVPEYDAGPGYQGDASVSDGGGTDASDAGVAGDAGDAGDAGASDASDAATD